CPSRRVAEGSGPPIRARGRDGEALHRRAVESRCQLGTADPRRLRLHGRVPDLPPVPRPEDPGDRRGHERSAADGHRPRARTVTRRAAGVALVALAAATPAAAHVIPQPAYLTPGIATTISFAAPNERLPHVFTRLTVTVPAGVELSR